MVIIVDEDLHTAILRKQTGYKVYLLGEAGFCLIANVYLLLSLPICNKPACNKVRNLIELVLRFCCIALLGTPKGMFDNPRLEDRELRINNRKLSRLALLTMSSYVVSSVLLIFNLSLEAYITVDITKDHCFENSHCRIFHKVTKEVKITQNCLEANEEPDTILLGCYNVSYKLNDALALAGGLLTVAKLVPQVTVAITSRVFLLFSHCSELVKKLVIIILSGVMVFLTCAVFPLLLMMVILIDYMKIVSDSKSDLDYVRYIENYWVAIGIFTTLIVTLESSLKEESPDTKNEEHTSKELTTITLEGSSADNTTHRSNSTPSDSDNDKESLPEVSKETRKSESKEDDDSSDEETNTETQKLIN